MTKPRVTYHTLVGITVIADNLKLAEDRLLAFDRTGPMEAARYIRCARGQVDDLFAELKAVSGIEKVKR